MLFVILLHPNSRSAPTRTRAHTPMPISAADVSRGNDTKILTFKITTSVLFTLQWRGEYQGY